MSFLGLTYLHLSGALGVTAFSAENPLYQSITVILLENILVFVILFTLLNIKPGPFKYFLFFIFCLLIGQIMAPKVKSIEKRGIMREVLASVGGIFLAMTAVGFLDNQNLLGMGAYLVTALFGLILARVLLIFLKINEPKSLDLTNTNQILSWVSTLLFAIFVAYDTQLLKERQKKPHDYIDSSIGLFLDIINLFSSESR